MTEFDDEIEVNLRPIVELMDRITLLVATSQRVALEDRAFEAEDEDVYALETDRFELYEWVRKTFPSAPSESELAVLGTPVGELAEDIADARATDAESSLAIGWVLGLVDNLSFDVPSADEIDNLRAIAPQPWDRADKLAKRVAVRDEAEVWEERERWYIVYVRGLIDTSNDRAAVLADLASDASATGLSVRNGELLIGDESYATLTQDFKTVLTGAAGAYVKALTWACGFGDTWENVPLDDI